MALKLCHIRLACHLALGPSWGSSGLVIKPSGRRFKNFKSKFADAMFSLSAALDLITVFSQPIKSEMPADLAL